MALAEWQRFQSCGKCEEGWVRVFEGKTYKGNRIEPQIGAVRRCECWVRWRDSIKGPSSTKHRGTERSAGG